MSAKHVFLGIALLGLLTGCARQAVVTSGPGVEDGMGAGEALLIAELQRLQASQEVYRAENGVYGLSLSALDFSPRTGVEVDVLEANAIGWAAIATTPAGDAECALHEGDARAPRAYVSAPGDVFCRSD
jgi:hypothetical protein